MADDYANAATRHFRDGELLAQEARISNADQLFGFAAECAIKSALVCSSACADDGALIKRYREHINKLWGLAVLNISAQRFRGLVAVLKGLPQPFSDWSTDRRYEADAAVTDVALQIHRQAAKRVLGSVGLTGTRAGAG